MSDVRVESNASAVAADMRAAAQAILDTAAGAVAEASIAFNEDLRGPSPGAGVTPFRTGNLQSRGRITQTGLTWNYKNDARPYKPSNAGQGDRVSIQRGKESYASHAHFSGAATGQFAADAEAAFEKHFGSELEDMAERAIAGLFP